MWSTVEVNRGNMLATGYFGSRVAVFLNDRVLAALTQPRNLVVPVGEGSPVILRTEIVLSYQQRSTQRLIVAQLPVTLPPDWQPVGCQVVGPTRVLTAVVAYPGPPPYLVQTVEYGYDLSLTVATATGAFSFVVPAPPAGMAFVSAGVPPVEGEAQVYTTCAGWGKIP